MSLKIVKECKDPLILVVTPLFTGHHISRETKVSIKRNDTPFLWISYEGSDKHAANCQNGIYAFHREFHYLPKYIQILDNDITLGRYMLDRLVDILDKTNDDIAYAYCGFEYKGHINLKIPVCDYDLNKLKQRNYISSNSLYKTDVLDKVRGFVTDYDTNRLSDWAMFLKLAINKYKGVFVPSTSFIAMSTKNDISAGSNEEFFSAKQLIQERYINKLK
jgi:hypothetical protein